MTKLLNRVLNFYITPETVNLTEIQVSLTKFENKMRWKEIFALKNKNADEEDPTEWKPGLFYKT